MIQNVSVAGPGFVPPPYARTVSWPNWDINRLSPAHERIWRSDARAMLLHGGRDAGKTHIGHMRGMRLALRHYLESKRRGKTRLGPVTVVCVAAPVSTNYKQLIRRFKDLVPDIPGKAPNGNPNVHWAGQECELFGDNELVITFCSGKIPENIRGNGFDVLMYVECAFENESTLHESFLPLCRGRSGYAGYVILDSTPGKRRGNWWDAAVWDARRGVGYWGDGWELHEITKYDNPVTDAAAMDELRRLKANNLPRYRREYMGWVDIDVPSDRWVHANGAGLAFEPGLLTEVLLSTPHTPVGPFCAGADIAGAGDDPFTMVVVDAAGVIVDLRKQAKSNTSSILDEFDAVNAKWHPRWIAYDASGKLGCEVRGRLKICGAKPIKPRAGGSKTELVEHLEQHLLQGSIRLPHPELCPFEHKLARWNQGQLWSELCEYLVIDTRSESIRSAVLQERISRVYTKPPHGADDFLDALVYCVEPLPVPSRNRTNEDRCEVRQRMASARIEVPW